MSEPKLPQLPFLTREMLKFGNDTPMRIRLSCASDKVGTVTLRGITRSGIIDIATTTTADGKITAQIIGVDDFPIMLSITDEANSFLPGQCWVNAELEITGQETITLCSGFIYINKGVSYPAIVQVDSVPGRGYFAEVQSDDPAAGAEISLTVPEGEMWHVLAMTVDLNTDANGANRKPHFVFTLPTAIEINCFSDVLHVANLIRKYSVAKYPTMPVSEGDNDILVPLPHDIFLNPGSTITTLTENLQVGDNWTKLTVLVEKFFGFAEN